MPAWRYDAQNKRQFQILRNITREINNMSTAVFFNAAYSQKKTVSSTTASDINLACRLRTQTSAGQKEMLRPAITGETEPTGFRRPSGSLSASYPDLKYKHS